MTALAQDINFWNGLRTTVRLLDPIIKALRELEADNVFVSGVYKWFRWLRFHSAYGVTTLEQERASSAPNNSGEGGIELLSNTVERVIATAYTENPSHSTMPEEERLVAGTDYQNVIAPPLSELQAFFRGKIKKRWDYVHTNAMGIAFMLDPAMDLDDFVGLDDETVDEQIRKMAKDCRLLTPTLGIPKLTAEILNFKSKKRSGGEALRETYSESSPLDYWNAKSNKEFPLLKKIAAIVFSIPTSSAASERAWIFDHIHSKRRNRLSVEKVEMLAYIYINHGSISHDAIDLARHQSCPKSVDSE
ncbi:hypothetical protein AM588_10007524 [Phytophthora nicotianae]|uniref:HAT C-terminal dimerisation domain-containing protein n=1 Tax=Phytophthora nicotianae TaxID=4792 RepID=A0A0W8DPN3_PHYNI|nr:hypothetical protein AM588_10007524 [Phytophthora nicotianae]